MDALSSLWLTRLCSLVLRPLAPFHTRPCADMRNARLSEADDAGVAPTADELAQGNGAVHTDLSPAELLVSDRWLSPARIHTARPAHPSSFYSSLLQRASQVLADLTVDAPTTFYDEEPAST